MSKKSTGSLISSLDSTSLIDQFTQEKFSSKWAVFAIAQLVIFFIMINFFQSAQFFQATQKSENGKTSNSILNFQVLNLQSSDSSSSNPKSSDKTSLENEEIKTESKIYPVPKEEPEQFHCPTFRELDSVPESCYENTPKHPAIYKSSFYPIYPPRNPGPSEQTHGIKDVVMAAVELGKSVIISNFTTHFSDSHSKCFIIPFGGRVDLESLCRFVTLKDSRKMIEENPELKIDTLVTLSNNHNVPWEQHQLTRYLKENAACGNYKFDGICKWSSLEGIEDLAKFKNISIWGTKYSNFPHNDGENLYKTFIDNDIAYDKPEVIGLAHSFNWIYGNTYQFIDSGGAYRFRNPVFGESLAPVISEDYAREKLGIKRGLLKDTYLATRHPKFIRILARMFIEEELNETTRTFVAVHWRFNQGDFFTRDILEKKEEEVNGRGLPHEAAVHLWKTLKDPRYFLDLLIPHLERNFHNSTQHSGQKVIFITSPMNIAKNFQKIGRDYKGYKLYNSMDTERFLNSFKMCKYIEQTFGDTISTLEKEILVQSLAFYRARPSNWSFNIQGHRYAEWGPGNLTHDRVVYDVFLNRHRKRRDLLEFEQYF